MIGLGRMGGNMAKRLRRAGHDVVGYARSPGGRDVASLEELVERLAPPRTAWVMVPAGEATQQIIAQLRGLLEAGDLVIDGGNSHYSEDRENARRLGARKIGFIDAGVSGGIWGLENGYGLMVGGEDADVTRVMRSMPQPTLASSTPSGAATPRWCTTASSTDHGGWGAAAQPRRDHRRRTQWRKGMVMGPGCLTAGRALDDDPGLERSAGWPGLRRAGGRSRRRRPRRPGLERRAAASRREEARHEGRGRAAPAVRRSPGDRG
jgi:hypothetical protein